MCEYTAVEPRNWRVLVIATVAFVAVERVVHFSDFIVAAPLGVVVVADQAVKAVAVCVVVFGKHVVAVLVITLLVHRSSAVDAASKTCCNPFCQIGVRSIVR